MQPLEVKDENLIRDGLQFKRDLGTTNSSLSCFMQGLFVLREICIEKAKKAHSRKNEERASFYMGMVEGVDECIKYPKKMVAKWERLAQSEMFKGESEDEAR